MSKAFRIRPSGLSSRIIICLVGMSLLMSISAFASNSAAIELRDGVLISPSQGILYMMNPAGGIDGVDLSTGSVVWQTREADKPLMLDGDLLVAQGEGEDPRQIQITTFNTQRSGQIEQQMTVDLPNGILGWIDAHIKGSLTTRAARQGEGVLLTWDAKTRFPRGVSPRVQEQLAGPAIDDSKQARRHLPSQRGYSAHEGAALLDLQQGVAKALAPSDVVIAKQGQNTAAGLREVVGASLRIDEPGRHFSSNDGQHVLVSARRAEAEGPRYVWTLFTADGDRLGQVQMDVAASPFVVLGQRLITSLPMRADQTEDDWTVRPLRIETFDLSSGAAEGSWELRDLEFRGPFPQ